MVEVLSVVMPDKDGKTDSMDRTKNGTSTVNLMNYVAGILFFG